MERAVLMVRRAEIAQPRVRLAARSLATAPRSGATCRSPARPRPARPVPRRPSPAASAAAAGRVPRRARRAASRSRAQRLEAAHDAAFADHAPGALRLGKAGERLRPEILELEQRADLPSRALGDHERARLGQAPAAGRRGSASRRPRRAPARRPRRSDRRPRRGRWRCRAAHSAVPPSRARRPRR